MAARLAAGAVLALLAGGCAADEGGASGPACMMRQIADLPVLNDRGSPIVRAEINDTPVAFIVDTGASVSTLNQDDVAALGLPVSFENRHVVTGLGGSTFAPDATVAKLSLGSAATRNVSFVSVGAFRRRVDGLKVVGLFGGDFLANYDVEFDLPAHRVALYVEQTSCAGRLRPWLEASRAQPFTLRNQTEIVLPIAVNGRTVEAQLDSGAARTLLDDDAVEAAGVTRAALAADRRTVSVGVDGNPVRGWLHRFDSLDIAGEHVAPAFVNAADSPRTLLGADFLHTHQVWVSYPHAMLYIRRDPRYGTAATAATPR